MKTIEEMLQYLGTPNVSEFALVSDRLPCAKVNNAFKPVDDYAPKTDEILQMLVAAGGSWYVASLGPNPTQWTVTVEGIGTVGVQVVMRDRVVQARFMVVQRDPFAAAAPPLPPQPPPPSTMSRPGMSQPGSRAVSSAQTPGADRAALRADSPSQPRAQRPNMPVPPAPPSSAVALIANEPFFDDEPRTGTGQPATQRFRPPPTPMRAPQPAPPAIVPMEPGTEPSDQGSDLFEFEAPAAPLPPPAAPEAIPAPNWKRATQISAPEPPRAPAPRQAQPTRPELPRPELLQPELPVAGGGDEVDARAEMDGLVLRLAEELDVGPRRVRVIIELVLETIDRTGLPPREALEALAAAGGQGGPGGAPKKK